MDSNRPVVVTRRGGSLQRAACILAAGFLLGDALAACEERSDLQKCMDDKKCAAAMEAVDQAQNTVNTVCPKNERETNPACDAAVDARNAAEDVQAQLQPK
jgi:hypothetical protein